jgi:hypothetical protein
MGDEPIIMEQFCYGFEGLIMGPIVGSQNIRGLDYGSNIIAYLVPLTHPMKRICSHNHDKRRLINIPGTLNAIHEAKFNSVSPYFLNEHYKLSFVEMFRVFFSSEVCPHFITKMIGYASTTLDKDYLIIRERGNYLRMRRVRFVSLGMSDDNWEQVHCMMH